MTVTHTNATPVFLRNQLADLVVDAIDVGGVGAYLLETSVPATLVSLAFQATAFGAAGAGTATANLPIGPTNATAAGTAAQFTVNDGNGDPLFSGSVGLSGTDMIITNVTIGIGDPISITAMTYSSAN